MKRTLIHLTLCADFEYHTFKSSKQESLLKKHQILILKDKIPCDTKVLWRKYISTYRIPR